MKFWVKSGGVVEFSYRDDGETEVCERCLSEDIRGKCQLGRYAVRRERSNSDYIFCYEQTVPGKQAKYLSKITANSFKGIVSAAESQSKDISNIQTIAYHNAKKLNASIGQKIDSIFPSESDFIKSSSVDSIKLAMTKNSDGVAAGILSVRKIVEQVEAEYNLVEILGQSEPFSLNDLTSIRIHKLLVGVYYNYREVLEDRKISVDIRDTSFSIAVDYSIAKSSIGQILSNAAKYCRQDSKVFVDVRKAGEFFEVVFSMTSLYFSISESTEFGAMGVRGSQVKEISGDGIGLYAVGLFQKMHKGYLKMESNQSTKFTSDGKEYSQNEITLGFYDYRVLL